MFTRSLAATRHDVILPGTAASMVALPMCGRDIGDCLGLTLETVSPALSQLHDQRVLSFSGARRIVIGNQSRLRDINV